MTALTTRMLSEAKDVGRAEALRRSMIALMNNTKANYSPIPSSGRHSPSSGKGYKSQPDMIILRSTYRYFHV